MKDVIVNKINIQTYHAPRKKINRLWESLCYNLDVDVDAYIWNQVNVNISNKLRVIQNELKNSIHG